MPFCDAQVLVIMTDVRQCASAMARHVGLSKMAGHCPSPELAPRHTALVMTARLLLLAALSAWAAAYSGTYPFVAWSSEPFVVLHDFSSFFPLTDPLP